jgi:twitching motility protein PilJ
MPDKQNGARYFPLLMGVALVFIVLAVALLAWEARSAAGRGTGPQRILETGLIAQRIPLEAASALAGDATAYDSLERSTARLNQAMESGATRGLGDASAWQTLASDARTVVEAREAVVGAHRAADDVQAIIPDMLSGVANAAAALGPQRVSGLAEQLARFEATGLRAGDDMRALADGTGDTAAVARRLVDGVDFLGEVLGGLGAAPDAAAATADLPADARTALAASAAAQARLSDLVRSTVSSVDRIVAAREAGTRLAATALDLQAAAAQTVGQRGTRGLLASPWLPLALLAVALLALAALAVQHFSTADVRREAQKQARHNARNQEAILRLLDELSSLADGDLTVQATVTEDITGAIADSINYAIEALRELVATINGSAITLDASTRQTQATAGHLAKASVAQSKQIGAASESTAAMAASIEEVSGNAERSADVARHSVDIAHKGGDAVRRTIDGMNAIRDAIQETSKRIKRLGESSQEIGNIVELINDIAEQTNILALNASIQASMAGEAGRGFAVVADEVQRLAERAANATKQIEVLVRTIQADTNEAVVSMERSTTDVVGGALLAENAGAALEEIEKVSNQIASLVQNISASARQQASAAGNVSRNMQVLREISSQAAENTSATSTSIGKLAELATQLRKSVSGFRLPASGGSTTLIGTEPEVDVAPAEPPPQRKLGGVA